jgi:hypothetical protein
VIRGHPLPLIRVSFLKGESLGIRAVGQDHGILAILWRAVDIGPCYVINPELPEWDEECRWEGESLSGEYGSADGGQMDG